MSKKNWVPGFIWLTPREEDVRHKDGGARDVVRYAGPPMLVAVNQIVNVVAVDAIPGGVESTWSQVWSAGRIDPSFDVIETPEEIAELIRLEWESRVSRDAEIRWASTTGERR